MPFGASRSLDSGSGITIGAVVHVHHDHGWTEFLGQFHRLPPVFGFADDLKIPFGLQQGPQLLTDNRLVIRQQDGVTVSTTPAIRPARDRCWPL